MFGVYAYFVKHELSYLFCHFTTENWRGIYCLRSPWPDLIGALRLKLMHFRTRLHNGKQDNGFSCLISLLSNSLDNFLNVATRRSDVQPWRGGLAVVFPLCMNVGPGSNPDHVTFKVTILSEDHRANMRTRPCRRDILEQYPNPY